MGCRRSVAITTISIVEWAGAVDQRSGSKERGFKMVQSGHQYVCAVVCLAVAVALGAAPTEVAAQVVPADLDICADFESGALPAHALATTNSNGAANGRVQVTSNNPYSGTYAVEIDTDCNGCGGNTTQSVTLYVNLAGEPTAWLNFWVIEFGDENNPEDGVFISDDGGVTVAQILSLNNYPNSYTNVDIDLATAITNAGMSMVDGFQITFQSLDNFSIPTDGYAFDDICVTRNQVPVELMSFSVE